MGLCNLWELNIVYKRELFGGGLLPRSGLLEPLLISKILADPALVIAGVKGKKTI